MCPMRHLTRIAVLAGVVAAGFGGCSSSPTRRPGEPASWVLSEVQIDEPNIKNAGSLPVYHRSDLSGFGSPPQAYGVMQASDDGLVAIQVNFREVVVGLGGGTASHEYAIVDVVGHKSDDGRHVVRQGINAPDARLGTVTEVFCEKVSDTRMRVQPATNGVLLPYIFTFEASLGYQRPVAIPQI